MTANTVSKEKDRLHAQIPGQDPLEFLPESETKFFTLDVDMQIVFVKNQDGDYNKIRVNYRGQRLELTRTR